MEAAAPRRGRPGYDQESLLAVAVKVFNERGYEATSMEELSRKLGITKSAIYHHVSSKEELLRLAMDRALDGLFAVADEAHSMDGRAIDRLDKAHRERDVWLTWLKVEPRFDKLRQQPRVQQLLRNIGLGAD